MIPDHLRQATPVASIVRAIRSGVPAAWRTPAVVDRSLPELLAPATVTSLRAHPDDARRAVHVSHRILGRLARIRPSRWRSTCLYRSVVECLVLRALGHPARVVIGVGVGVGAEAGAVGVMAHAWVECSGIECVSTRGAAELERMSPRAG